MKTKLSEFSQNQRNQISSKAGRPYRRMGRQEFILRYTLILWTPGREHMRNNICAAVFTSIKFRMYG
jgi:hypothetical protein